MTSSPALKPSERTFARRIDLTSLQLFVAVCELGSIGKAAEREFIAASAVSKRLSDLEAHAGHPPALPPHPRRRPDPGRREPAAPRPSVLFSLEKMQGELSEYADGVRGHVRVHASISAVVQFLPEDLGRFIQDHPEVKIDLEEHLSTEVVRAVQEGAADLGICNTAVLAAGHGLQTRPYRQRPAGADRAPAPSAGPAQPPSPSRTRWTATTWGCTPTARSTWRCGTRPRPPAAPSGCASMSRAWMPCAA